MPSDGAMNNRSFPAIKSLIAQLEQAAAEQANLHSMLAVAIKRMPDKGVDPYLLAGLLIEGAVHTVMQHIPRERQRDTTHDLVRLLIQRLLAHGAWPEAPGGLLSGT
jgi:hypothetical protein